MGSILKRIGLGLIALLVVALVVALGIGAKLAFPAKPKSTASLAFAGFIPLPKGGSGLLHVLDYLTIDGRSLYVTSESSGDVYKVPLGDGALPGLTSVEVSAGSGAAHGVVIDPVSKLAFVSRSDANVVDVFDPTSLAILKHIPVDDDVDGIFYDPANKLIAAASGDPRTANLIDPATRSKVGSLPLGGKPEFAAFDPQTKLLYQNLTDTNQVAVVDLAKRAVIDRWALNPCQGPTSVALDVASRRLFAVCSKNALLVVVNMDSHKVVSTTAIGDDPDSVAYDPSLHRLYSTGKAGVLSVIQQDSPDSYHTADTVKLHYGAHTLAIDPVTHRLYVAYASLLVAPRLAVFDPRH